MPTERRATGTAVLRYAVDCTKAQRRKMQELRKRAHKTLICIMLVSTAGILAAVVAVGA